MTRVALLAALILSLTASVAEAQQAAPACAEALRPGGGGGVLTYAGRLTEEERIGLSAATWVTLRDSAQRPGWPTAQMEAAPPCPLESFDAADGRWTLSGGAGERPLRWARRAGRADYLVLVGGPSPGEAYELFQQGAKGVFQTKRPTYFLASVSEGVRVVFRLYDGAPSQGQLIGDMQSVLAGRLRPLVLADPAGDAVSVAVSTQSGLRAQLFGSRQLPATLYGPDGEFFSPAGGETVELEGSGFRCPNSFGRLQRSRLLVVNREQTALDLGCGFVGGDSWITVFVSRAPAPRDPGREFAARLEDAQKAGVARKLAASVPGFPVGETWVDKDGARQGLWLAARGPWLVEVRLTYAEADEEAALRAIGEIARAAAEIPER